MIMASKKDNREMEYNFVSDLPEDHTCQICMKLLNEPQLTDCCGQHFCHKCLDQWFQEQGKKQCPHCRSENFTHILYLPLKRKINELKVYCSNLEKGCGLTLKLEELERHLSTDNTNGCGYVKIQCRNGCGQSVLRKDMTHHLANTCLERKVKCKYCKEAGAYSYITNTIIGGHVKQCQEYPIKCPKSCGIEGLKRKNLLEHKNVCPLQPVQCPYHKVGCKDQLVRKDLNDHLQSNTQQHLMKLMLSHTMALKELNELKSTAESVKLSNQVLRSTVASVASQLERIQVEVKDTKVATSLEKLSKTLSGITLQLTKEGDQLKFRIPCGSFDWVSPVFRIDDSKLKLVVIPPNTVVSTALGVFNQSIGSLSLILLAGNLSGQYEANIDIKCDQRTEKPISLFNMSATNGCIKLCDKCCRKPTFMPQSTEPILGQKIEQVSLPTSFDSGCYEVCTVTLTLKAHHCSGPPPSLLFSGSLFSLSAPQQTTQALTTQAPNIEPLTSTQATNTKPLQMQTPTLQKYYTHPSICTHARRRRM